MAEAITVTIVAVVVVIAAFLSAMGLILFKKAMNETKGYLRLLTKSSFLLGVLLYGLNLIFSMIALRLSDLTFIVPLTSSSYVFSLFLSKKMLGEKIFGVNIIGIILICLGVTVLLASGL